MVVKSVCLVSLPSSAGSPLRREPVLVKLALLHDHRQMPAVFAEPREI
jgi:hypothetical protein